MASARNIWVQKKDKSYRFCGLDPEITAYWEELIGAVDDGRFLHFRTCTTVEGPVEEVLIPISDIQDITLTPEEQPDA